MKYAIIIVSLFVSDSVATPRDIPMGEKMLYRANPEVARDYFSKRAAELFLLDLGGR